jgi:hypothetical protein
MYMASRQALLTRTHTVPLKDDFQVVVRMGSGLQTTVTQTIIRLCQPYLQSTRSHGQGLVIV